MNNKHIETSRELRLWLGQVILPAVTGIFLASPTARDWAKTKIDNLVKRIKSKLDK